MSNLSLTDAQLAELQALEKLSDEDIYTGDIPEITDEQWRLARKGNLYRPLKQSVTILGIVDDMDGNQYSNQTHGADRQHLCSPS
ncbi:BrnA antitoxin family protein [Rhizobium johnstonii]|uniref:BrnA antitoxin family protein n=1 Tax=Rhizobium johnstonii TaxID=3019933 RepID=UPI003F98414A